MCPFIETIRIEDGIICHLKYHNARLNKTRNTFWKGCSPLDLANYLHPEQKPGRIKCRIVYKEQIKEVTYTPYTIRPINSLRIVHSDTIDYSYKSSDRTLIDELYSLKAQQDDILIVKNGLLTDTSIANIALWDGNQWYTPKAPLLKGTQREALLAKSFIIEKNINVEELYNYSHISLFNAMINIGQIRIKVNKQNLIL